ncbi:MAG: M20/M25/M40 family metallo-hydrolase [Rikenellaceae bacterium]
MRKILTSLFVIATINAYAQKSEGLKTITQNGVEAKLAFLSSDLLEGREAGERGGYIAGEYIAAKLCELGLMPFDTLNTGILPKYMQPFKAIKAFPKGATISIENDDIETTYDSETDFDYTIIGQSVKIKGELVLFDGSQDCKEKIAVIIGENSKETIAEATKKGATAIFCYNETKNNKTIAEKAFSYHVNETMYEGYEPRTTFKDVKLVLDNSKPSVPVFNISKRMYDNVTSDSEASIKITVKTEPRYLRNILGSIEGEIADEYVIIGAHYDHLGVQDGYIYNGADDNGSGVVALMEIAEAMVASGMKPKRTVIFAFWDAEERGLYGSRYFVSQVENPNDIKGYINFDMIGRGSEPNNYKSVSYMYTSSTPQFKEILQSNVEETELDLKVRYAPNKNPIGGSDNTSFAEVGVPIAWFLTAGHPDYHQPSDEIEKINMEKITKVAKAAYLVLFDYANN